MKKEEFIVKEIIYMPIGFIKSNFKKVEDIPPQSVFAKEEVATIELNEEYVEGLKDLDKSSHIVVQFHFHESIGFDLHTLTPWSDERKGVFATRSPRRPNPIGITIAEVLEIKGNQIIIKGVDMLDGTPVLDIKPYVPGLNPKI